MGAGAEPVNKGERLVAGGRPNPESVRSRRASGRSHRPSASPSGPSTGAARPADINQATRAKVLELAESIGYRPTSRPATVSRKLCRFGVNLPKERCVFLDLVRDGIQDGRPVVRIQRCEVVHRLSPPAGGDRGWRPRSYDNIDGLVIAPGRPESLAPLMRRAAGEASGRLREHRCAGIEHLDVSVVPRRAAPWSGD